MVVYGIPVLVSFSISVFINVILPQSKQRRKFILSSHYGDFFCLFPLLVICERFHYTSKDIFVKQVDVEAKRIVNRLHVGISIK